VSPLPFRGELLSRDAAVLERMARAEEAVAAYGEALANLGVAAARSDWPRADELFARSAA
jgi:hypothetical protein